MSLLRVTPQERLALGVTALLLAAGAGARLLALDRDPLAQQESEAPTDTLQDTSLQEVREAAAAALARERVRATPLAPGEKIDLNSASADVIDRLPRVGPELATRIVEWRSSRGRFRSLAELDSVPGVGPALISQVAPYLDLARAPAGPTVLSGPRDAALNVNRATVEELDALSGIGPVLAQRIVEWRETRGPFATVEALEEVPGIGPALLAKLAGRIRTGP